MSDTATIVGTDNYSDIAESGGIYYRLTNCCKASAKGSMDAVVCRSCYREIDDMFGQAWTNAEDLKTWTGITVA